MLGLRAYRVSDIGGCRKHTLYGLHTFHTLHGLHGLHGFRGRSKKGNLRRYFRFWGISLSLSNFPGVFRFFYISGGADAVYFSNILRPLFVWRFSRRHPALIKQNPGLVDSIPSALT